MRKGLAFVVLLAAVAAAVVAVVEPRTAEGVTTGYLTLSGPAFSAREYSDHNGPTSSACATQVTLTNAGEHLGDLDNGQGSYFANVALPQGATVIRFDLLVNDADSDTDVFAYLVRKKVVDGLSPHTTGYGVMAAARSTGAVTATIRQFSDSTITGPVLDNSRFEYFVELVDCGIPEPFAVRLTYTTP